MWKVWTLASAAGLLLVSPAMAQEGTAVGIAGGAATGAVLGGPPGAVIGGVAGGALGTAIAPPRPYVVQQPVPAPVYTYVQQQPVQSVTVAEPIAIGQPLPPTVAVYQVPSYPSYGYAVVNQQPVIVDAQTRGVVQVGY